MWAVKCYLFEESMHFMMDYHCVFMDDRVHRVGQSKQHLTRSRGVHVS